MLLLFESVVVGDGNITYNIPTANYPKYVVQVNYSTTPATWYLAGWISLLVDLPSVGFAVDAKTSIGFNENVLLYPRNPISQLIYYPVGWLPGTELDLFLWGIS